MNDATVESGVSLADQIAAKQQAISEAKAVILSRGARDHNGGWWSSNNAMTMSASVLLFGAIIMLVLLYHIKTCNITDHESRIFIVVLVVVSSMFLVVAGYSDSQIAPVMGLLGTITGYVLRGSAVAEPPKVVAPSPPNGPQGVQAP
jgi:membrane-associated HD superfamily phosphohydrolase